MRYYSVYAGGSVWSSTHNGANDPGALDIDFDILLSGPTSSGSLTIRGIDPQNISEATVYTGQRIQVFGGFTDGLPLANIQLPHQGLICDGQIYPSFGNWTGNDLSLTFIINPGNANGSGGPTEIKNIVHNMAQGSPLSTALLNTLQTAFPNSQFLVNIKDSLVLNTPDQGFYQGLEQYMNYIKTLSHSIAGTPSTNGYQGVQIFPTGYGKYVVTDFSNSGGSIAIQFEDLVGQPTWIGFNTIQVKTVLRADFNAAMSAGGAVDLTLPNPIFVNTTAQGAWTLSNPELGRNTYEHGNILLFNGSWRVKQIRHIGHYRQPTGESWVTIIDATSNVAGGLGQGIQQNGGQQSFAGANSGFE
jgi:hypothetical protein